MSAAIMLRQRDSIHLLVDAASYYSDGVVAGFIDKCRAMPELRCAVTTLGASLWQPIIFDAISQNFASYDEVKGGIGRLLERVFDEHAAAICDPGLWAAADVWVVGWSDELQAPDGFTICMDYLDDYAERAVNNPNERRPFVVDTLAALGLNLHPCPTGEQLFEARFPVSLAESDRLTPAIDLLQLIEVQRRIRYRGEEGHYFIGGYALLTTVDRNGATQRKIHSWPEDRVGELITPQPIDWLKWRAEREAAGTNRHQRRRLAARG